MRWIALALLGLCACKSDAFVLHRVGNPPSIYIAKFDALGSELWNRASCDQFIDYVHRASRETGPVKCSPAP